MLGMLLVAAVGVAEPMQEEPGFVPLFAEWDAPAECPDREGLRAAIEAELGQRVRFEDDAVVRVSGTAIAIADGYRVDLVIVVGEDREQRVMTAPACVDAVQASALVVAVALEPFLATPVAAVPEPLPMPEPPRQAEVAPAPARPASSPRPPRRRFDHRAALFVGGGGAFATTDDAVGVVHGGAAWLIERARIELSAQHMFATTPERPRDARRSLTGGALRGCWMPRLRMFELGPCGGLEVMALRAEGTGDDVVGSPRSVPWVGLLAGVDAAWLASPWFVVRASVGASVVPRRPRLHITSVTGNEQVFLAPPVGARVTLALELRLPG